MDGCKQLFQIITFLSVEVINREKKAKIERNGREAIKGYNERK